MYKLNPPRPGFKRSSERKVVDPNEAIRIAADRRCQRELAEFEAIGFTAAAASVVVRKPTFEELYDAMVAEDLSTYDLDGCVR